MVEALEKWATGIRTRLREVVRKAVISSLSYSSDIPVIKIEISSDEIQDDVELIMQYGFISRPSSGTPVLMLNPNGDRSQGIAILPFNKTGSPSLNEGDSALYNSDGAYIICKGKDIEVYSPSGGNVKVFTDKFDVNNGNLTVE